MSKRNKEDKIINIKQIIEYKLSLKIARKSPNIFQSKLIILAITTILILFNESNTRPNQRRNFKSHYS